MARPGDAASRSPYVQLKAVESLGRLKDPEAVQTLREILEGKKSPRRDVVLVNAAAALVAAGKADHLRDAIPLAAKAIDSGAAAQKLEALTQFSNLVR
jgi:anthranilate phosphoribosyltransferase